MRVICKKCNSTASSKCPWTRSIFPSQESQAESSFWHGMAFDLAEGTLTVTMDASLIGPITEVDAMKYFINKFRQIPADKVLQYACKHTYEHTEDCIFCGYKVERMQCEDCHIAFHISELICASSANIVDGCPLEGHGCDEVYCEECFNNE